MASSTLRLKKGNLGLFVLAQNWSKNTTLGFPKFAFDLETIWENFQCNPLDFYTDDIPRRETEIMFGEN